MAAVWLTSQLADAIIAGDEIYVTSIVTDLLCGKIDITALVENMGGVLINKEAPQREKGMRFLTSILKALPKTYLTEQQVNFISKFYVERLKDNHIMIPSVLEGYLAIIDMSHYRIDLSADFFTLLFREVACQSQVRQDRFNIYLIVKKIMDKNIEFMKTLGPDFTYGVISSIDGERDPRNLVFLFDFLPKFICNIPLGHLAEEIFEVISCYYPIDFQPVQNNPAAVSRQDLADLLAPCLCAIPEFSEQCLLLLIEKLDSSLRVAKLDSLKLLTESCKNFSAESYAPFLKTLWASIHRELTQKSDDEIKTAAQEALLALVKKIASTADTDQAFENFIKGILISMQRFISEATTVAQFAIATGVLLLTADASRDACLLITKSMIPAMITFYGLTSSRKLQISTLIFLGDLSEVSKKYFQPEDLEILKELPRLCLTAVSEQDKEYQLAGFQTLMKTKDVLESDLIVPFVDILIHNVQCSQDNDLLKVSVMTVNAIARKYPEEIMGLIVDNKCDLDNLTADKQVLQKRLNLLCNLASIGEFTKIIIEEMLKIISNNKDDAAQKVVKAMDESLSNGDLYGGQKVAQMESDHGLIDSILRWLLREIPAVISQDSLSHGYSLISTTMSSLPEEKQELILNKHTRIILELSEHDELYFLPLEALYSSVQQTIYNPDFNKIMTLALNISLNSKNETLRNKANMVIAHFLNKAEYVEKFEILNECLKNYLISCSKTDSIQCPRLLELYGWITKALLMRGSDVYMFWLQKIMQAISSPEYCRQGAYAIRIITSDYPDCLTPKQHARISLLYKQKLFQTFSMLTESLELTAETKESYLLCWAFILGKVPKSVLSSEIERISPLVIESLEYDKRDLLLVMVDILTYLVQANRTVVADSLQTILPRLLKLSVYVKSMDVRIKSLQCIYDIANNYPTANLLPYKSQILLDLAPSLDDKKRMVRNMAVRARTRWYLVGAPGELKEN